MTARDEALAILARQDGICPWCGNMISRYERFEIDHTWAKARGGPDTDDNKRALHKICHTEKTKGDVAAIAKTKRQRQKQDEHDYAMSTRTRRPNAKERARARMEERRLLPLAPRQE
ncbi:hypothetical protein LCGC14_0327250 [marine sediment metagenome]